jgi:transcriptional regulator with XRE-family HTH domain
MERIRSSDLKIKIDEHRFKISSNIKRIREESGISLEDLSFYSRLSVNTIRNLESGVLNPTITTLVQVSDGLRVPLQCILL